MLFKFQLVFDDGKKTQEIAMCDCADDDVDANVTQLLIMFISRWPVILHCSWGPELCKTRFKGGGSTVSAGCD